MNSDSPFTVHGDEPLEARIVAWVLGESSAFEAAELERLCEERPELLVFRRRMRTLHGLLTEAEAAQPDEGWKLPEEKRKVLDEIFGDEKTKSSDPVIEKRVGRSARRAILAIAACLILTVVVAGLLATGGANIQKARKLTHAREPEKNAEMAALSTRLPPELIEGTPKPINVPNLEAPVQGPAGSSSWGSDRSRLAESRDESSGRSQSESQVNQKRRVINDPASRALALERPHSNVARVMAEGALADVGELAAADSLKSIDGVSTFESKRASGGLAGGSGSGSFFELPASPQPASPAATPVPGAAPLEEMVQLSRSDADSFKDVDDAPVGQVLAAQQSATAEDGDGMGGASGTGGTAAKSESKPSLAPQVSQPAEAGRMLDETLRSNPALTDAHTANVDQVRRSLYVAEGNYNLGKYDDAKREYEAALRTDPYNAAARRGLERIDSAKTDNLRAAYDHTRAELLSQVDNAWELSVPADGEKRGAAKDLDSKKLLEEKSVLEDLAKKGPFDKDANTTLDRLAVDRFFDSSTEVQKGQESAKQVNPEWDTSKIEVSGKPSGEVEYELHAGCSSEYLFRGMDLGESKEVQPKPDLTKLMEEISAAEDPYSTFSLNISDASFQVAQAALAKGERPDPAGIKVEQFYNAVDYGDPAPTAGEPVAVSIEQSAHPVIPGRNLVRVALKTAAAGRSAAQPLRLTLLVDQSGSMVREDRRAAMDKALAGLAGLLTDKDLVTVVGFSRTPRLLADGMPGDKAGKLAELVNQTANEGGTNLEEAIKLGEQLADRRKLAGAQNRIVLFTDGAANLGNADPARLAEKVKQLRQKGIAFDIAGIAADGLNDELLGELARNGNGRYYVVGKGADDNLAKQLAGAFRPAAENVKVQVRFNPERVGRYKLIGFEKDRLKTEDFRNDAVDAAELAAEEAGVAVYQIEPLPGGNGELGEVSVRFRDAASAQMVERTWTIPHDDKAPAFDRAAPSMQLAVISMLAAEKLKGGPLGEAIDFKQLAEPRANVKRFYGTNGRVGEVLHMVDVLK